jgi:hypothetical protein
MNGRWLCSASLCFFLSAVAGTALGASPAASEPWSVKPDPGIGPVGNRPQNPTAAVGLGGGWTPVIYPTYSSGIAAIIPNLHDRSLTSDTLQVYDLRTLQPVGPAFASPVDLGNGHVLSPDGTYVACRPKGQHAVISVINARTGQALSPLQVDADPKRFARPVDFAGASRLLTMCHDSPFPDGGQQTLYQVWDLPTGREVARFLTGLVWNGNFGSVSPGGRYFVMEKTEIRSYRLLAWDLSTGKTAGETEFQGGSEPWGQASGMVFSPDGTKLAVVWRLGQKDLWGRVFVFDVASGRKIASVPLDYTMKTIGLALTVGENRSLQWNPAGDGWLILGHLLVDLKSGAVTGRIGKEPGAKWEVLPRRFVGPDFVTAIVKGKSGTQLTFEPVPKLQ